MKTKTPHPKGEAFFIGAPVSRMYEPDFIANIIINICTFSVLKWFSIENAAKL
jgi:hypothetical protein